MKKHVYPKKREELGGKVEAYEVSRLQELTLESKHDEPPLEVDTFIWLLPLSVSLSPSPTAEDGRLWEDMVGRFPEDERFLLREELLPAPLFSFWYSMGDWRATITHIRNIYILQMLSQALPENTVGVCVRVGVFSHQTGSCSEHQALPECVGPRPA